MHASDRLWFIVFNADQNSAGAENVGQDCGAFNELIGETLHQGIVGSDVRLAFSAIDQEQLNWALGPGCKFYGGRKARAAHAGNASVTHPFSQRGGFTFLPLRCTRECDPLIQTVGFDLNADILEARGVRDGSRLDRAHGTRGRRMHWNAHYAVGLGQQLASEDGIARRHNRHCRCAQVLPQWDYQSWR